MNLIELLRNEHDKIVCEIKQLVSSLSKEDLEPDERVKLRMDFKEHLSKAAELEMQLFDLASLNFRHSQQIYKKAETAFL